MRDYVDIKSYFYQTLGAADPTRSAAPKLMVVRVQRIQALILQKVNAGAYGDSGDEIDGFIAEGSDSSLSSGKNDEIEEFEEGQAARQAIEDAAGPAKKRPRTIEPSKDLKTKNSGGLATLASVGSSIAESSSMGTTMMMMQMMNQMQQSHQQHMQQMLQMQQQGHQQMMKKMMMMLSRSS